LIHVLVAPENSRQRNLRKQNEENDFSLVLGPQYRDAKRKKLILDMFAKQLRGE